MDNIGCDKNGSKLQMGDICAFKIDNKEYEGIIKYDEDVFAFVFEMEDNNFPCVVMLKADLNSIEKICGVWSTTIGDRFGFYRDIYDKPKRTYEHQKSVQKRELTRLQDFKDLAMGSKLEIHTISKVKLAEVTDKYENGNVEVDVEDFGDGVLIDVEKVLSEKSKVKKIYLLVNN
jgi:tRNA U34 2-thiouridine synthase MnmA/TrmU